MKGKYRHTALRNSAMSARGMITIRPPSAIMGKQRTPAAWVRDEARMHRLWYDLQALFEER